MKLTETELQSEWKYRYGERLGILCGSEYPTVEQDLMAVKEADEVVEKLREQP